jgi:hypothetical protein
MMAVEGVLDNPRLAPPDEMTKARENEEISQTKAPRLQRQEVPRGENFLPGEFFREITPKLI